MTDASGFTARQRAALPGSGYDRLVALLKLVLPLAAAALLGIIVIWPLTSAREFSFLLAKDKVAMSHDRLRIDNAVYRGETSKGQPFIIRAQDAVQRSSAVPIVELRRLSADLKLDSGPATVTAPSGRYDMSRDRSMWRGQCMSTAARVIRLPAIMSSSASSTGRSPATRR